MPQIFYMTNSNYEKMEKAVISSWANADTASLNKQVLSLSGAVFLKKCYELNKGFSMNTKRNNKWRCVTFSTWNVMIKLLFFALRLHRCTVQPQQSTVARVVCCCFRPTGNLAPSKLKWCVDGNWRRKLEEQLKVLALDWIENTAKT